MKLDKGSFLKNNGCLEFTYFSESSVPGGRIPLAIKKCLPSPG